MTDHKSSILHKIETKELRVAVIGLGYVGLPLAVAFAEHGFKVTGIDIDEDRVRTLLSGRSYVADVSSKQLQLVIGVEKSTSQGSYLRHHLSLTSSYRALNDCDAAIICVPTPLGKTRDPDMGFLLTAGQKVAQLLRPGMLICLESTTYPGTTEELIRPILEEHGLEVGKEIFLAFSPERIDPGRSELLRLKGVDTRYFDPHVPKISHNGFCLNNEPDLDRALIEADCTVVLTDHSCFDWTKIAQKARQVIDTRNALNHRGCPARAISDSHLTRQSDRRLGQTLTA